MVIVTMWYFYRLEDLEWVCTQPIVQVRVVVCVRAGLSVFNVFVCVCVCVCVCVFVYMDTCVCVDHTAIQVVLAY